MIPFQKPTLVELDLYRDTLKNIEESHFFTNYGPVNTLLEQRIVDEVYGGIGAVTTVNNATTGLILAIAQSMRQGGRYALMPSFTFAATPQAALWCGLEPYFVDVDPLEWCLDTDLLTGLVEELGDQVAVVVPYATFGTAMDLSCYEMLQARGIPVVVDAAPGFYTTLNAVTHGRGFSGSIVYSFHATKPFGIGEGGLIYSSDKALIERIRSAANFGFDQSRTAGMLGLNGKLAEFPAAIALATLAKFPEKAQQRRQIEQFYLECLNERAATASGWQLQHRHGEGALQFFSILCPQDRSSDSIVSQLAAREIQARTYFSPSCHEQPICRSCKRTGLVVTESLSRRIVSLPLWEGMTKGDVVAIVTGLLP